METTRTENRQSGSSEERDRTIGGALSAELFRQGSSSPCLTPEEIAACIDGTLEGGERDRVMRHLSGCSPCYKVFSLASELQQPEVTEVSRHTRWYWASGMAAVAVVALVVRLTVLSPAPEQQTARVAPPAGPQVALRTPPPEAPRPDLAPGKPVLAQRPATPAAGGELMLLTPEEAALPGSKSYGFSGRAVPDGPEIAVDSPREEDEQTGATRLRIRFAPQGAEKIDPASFKMEYLKKSPVDLTPRIKAFVNREGINADNVRLPPGLHHFRVSIADSKGRFSEKDFTVMVSGTF